MDLNSKLINSDLLYCSECLEFLNVPVVQLRNSENICGRCYVKNPHRDSTENKVIGEMLLMMVVPCRNRLDGCDTELPYEKMQSHEPVCSFRKYECVKTDCLSSGGVDDIVQHVEELHPGLLLLSDDNVFKFPIDLNAQGEVNRRMLKSDELFDLSWAIDGSVRFKVKHLSETDDEYSYRIEGYEIVDGEMVAKPSEKRPLERYREDSQTDWSDSVRVELDKLRALNLETLTIVLKVGESRSFDYEIDEDALDLLECPICIEYMLPPIYQCRTGHSVCVKCRSKFRNCPTCQAFYDETRNYCLEAVSATTPYPCPNAPNGCRIVLPADEIAQHENHCKRRTFSCVNFFEDCPWTGKLSDVFAHFKSAHGANEACETSTETNLRKDSSSYMDDDQLFYMIAFSHVFRIQYRVVISTAFWSFCLLCNCPGHEDFACEVTYRGDAGDAVLIKSGVLSSEMSNCVVDVEMSCDAVYAIGCNNVTVKIKKEL